MTTKGSRRQPVSLTLGIGLIAVIGAGVWHQYGAISKPAQTEQTKSQAGQEIEFDKNDSGNLAERVSPRSSTAAATAPDARITATLQRRMQAEPGLAYEVTNLAVQQESLLRAAQDGDLVAARTLHRALRTCPPFMPRNESELEQLRNQIDLGARSNFRRTGEPAEQGHSRLNAYMNTCGFLPSALQDQEYSLIAQLAEAGDSDARLEFPFLADRIDGRAPNASAVREAHPQLALHYLETELASGNALALRAMARSYQEGVLHRRDPVMAYAYLYAATLAPGDHRVLLETLPARAASLSADQLASAQRLAQEIYQRCCNGI